MRGEGPGLPQGNHGDRRVTDVKVKVKCWKCKEKFMADAVATTAPCPACEVHVNTLVNTTL